MRPRGRGPGWDGHFLLLYHEEPQRRAGVAAWVRRGLELDAKILYTEPPDQPSQRSLLGLLHHEPRALEALERGQIEVVAADQTAYDPAWQAGMVEQALRDGYPSVRWSGDATTAWSVIPQGRHADVEHATDELCRSLPVSVMCQYPARESMGVLGLVSTAHGAGLRERLFRAAPLKRGVAVSGELDFSNHDILRSLLLGATSTTEHDSFVVDLSGLDFVDVGGVRTLIAGTDPYRRHGGHVRLRAPQPHIDRLLRLLGVDRTEGILMKDLGR